MVNARRKLLLSHTLAHTQQSNDDNASFGFQIENEGTWQCYSCARPFVSPYRMLVHPRLAPTQATKLPQPQRLRSALLIMTFVTFCGAAGSASDPINPLLHYLYWTHFGIMSAGTAMILAILSRNLLIWQSFRQGDNSYGNCFLLCVSRTPIQSVDVRRMKIMLILPMQAYVSYIYTI